MGWCLSCFKVSTKSDLSEDPFEADLNDALARSRHEDAIAREKSLKEDEELARVIQESSNLEESSRLRLREKEEERRARELDRDAQIAHAFQYGDTERQLNNRSALDEEAKQRAKGLEESLKENEIRKKLEDEQVKKDAELALSLQESLNKLESPPQIDENNSIFRKVPLDDNEQFAKALEESLKEKKQIEDEQVKKNDQMKKDAELALSLQESLNKLESPPRIDENNSIFRKVPLDNDEQLAKALEESLKEKRKIEDEQVKKNDQMKKDAELALSLQESLNKLESPPRIDENNSIFRKVPLDNDEQLAKALEESLKEKKKIEDEQVKKNDQMKKDAELALSLQESLNKLESPPRIDESNSIFRKVPLENDEQLAKALEESSKEKGKEKQIENEQVKKDAELALMFQESLNPHTLEESNNISTSPLLDEDEQRIKRNSLKEEGQIEHSRDEVEENLKLLEVNPSPSICGGCNSVVEHEGSVNILGVLWHSGCFSCYACDRPIAIHVRKHVSNSRGNFHKSCYERYCYVCKEKKMKKYHAHHFWEERYCCTHETDGTPKCCSCERLEPRGTNYVMLEDGRWLCLECMDTALMDSDECQPLHFDMRDFFEGLNMKIVKEFPFLLVEKQALNKAEKEEKIDQLYEAVTRGICLSEEQIVDSVTKKPIKGPNNKLIGMATEPQKVVRECEVTGVLILYGLPRLLTGYILAHEMMHAYLRLSGHRNLNNVLEEGICQVLGHMWLESQTYATAADTTVDASSSAAASSSSPRTPADSASKKGEWSDFEKKLVGFCKHQIETDESPVYGGGFRAVNEMVTKSSLPETLKAIIGG